eukprot:jgi/Bigna1/89852/estExt_fgenesh1_pg.C_560129
MATTMIVAAHMELNAVEGSGKTSPASSLAGQCPHFDAAANCLTGFGGLFTEEVLKEFGRHHERPILFPMSNPTHKMECTAEEGQIACGGRAIFASGSPQEDVTMPDGRIIASSQSNNMLVVLYQKMMKKKQHKERKEEEVDEEEYVFPGLALGAKLVDSQMVSDGMLMAAAQAVPELLTESDLKEGRVYPSLKNIRMISTKVAARVMMCADQESLTSISPGTGTGKRLLALRNLLRSHDESQLEEYIKRRMYQPQYEDIVYMPPGIME